MCVKMSFRNVHKFQWLILLCMSLLFPVSAICDDALLKVYGGGLKLFDGESTTVRMESETVRIELHKKTYTVDATFEFFNYGKTMTAQVGFPKSGYGYAPSFKGVSDLNSFETWVNGNKVEVKEIPGEVTIDNQKVDAKQLAKIQKGVLSGPIEETRWLVKKVTFNGNDKTVTRVKYTAPYGDRREDRGEYLYGTGKSWKGTIGQANFIIKASPSMTLQGVQFTENGRYQNIRSSNFKRLGEYEYEYILKDFEPKENENLKFFITSNWEPWNSSTKHLERERLELLSLSQLKILRNSIYAFHGMIFKDPELDKYFRKYDWYKPRPDFKETELNNIEKENIASIMGYEKELRAALHKY